MKGKIVVPEGMKVAAWKANGRIGWVDMQLALTAALEWLAENPIIPSEVQAHQIAEKKKGFPFDPYEWVKWGAVEWQRRMFREAEEEIPEAIADLIWNDKEHHGHNAAVMTAYRRGKEGR